MKMVLMLFTFFYLTSSIFGIENFGKKKKYYQFMQI